jgi:hemoglobin
VETAMPTDLPDEISEALVAKLVETFYGRIRQDAVLGPIFEARLQGRWDTHLAAMVDFWSSVTMLAIAANRMSRMSRSA